MRPTAGGLRPDECGFASPPADGTPEREVVDRFADFLRAAGPPSIPARGELGTDGYRPPVLVARSSAHQYRIRFLTWRMEAFDALAEDGSRLLPWW